MRYLRSAQVVLLGHQCAVIIISLILRFFLSISAQKREKAGFPVKMVDDLKKALMSCYFLWFVGEQESD